MEVFTIKPFGQNVSSFTTLKYVLIAFVSVFGAFGCSNASRVQVRQTSVPSLKKHEHEMNTLWWDSQAAILLNYRQTLSTHVPAPPPSNKPVEIAMNYRNEHEMFDDKSVSVSKTSSPKSLSTFADCHKEEVAGTTSVCFMPEPILLEDPMIDADCADSVFSWCLPVHEENFLSYFSEQKSPEQTSLEFSEAIVPNFMPPVENGMILRGMQASTKKKRRGHYGVDIIPASFERAGTEIKSIEDGVVVLATSGRGYGYYTVIYHQNGLLSLYSHIQGKGRAKAGNIVKRGDVIGYMGKTGNARGYHLHFELIDVREAWNLKDTIDEFARKIADGRTLDKCENGQFSKLLFAKRSKIDPLAYIPNIAQARRVNGKWAATTQKKSTSTKVAKAKKKK